MATLLWAGWTGIRKAHRSLITLDDAKVHCRADVEDSNDELICEIAAAGANVENYLGLTYD